MTAGIALAQGAPPKPAAPPAWVQRSNENAKVLIQVLARFEPEAASQIGAEGFDEQIVDMKPGVNERSRRATREAIDELKRRLAQEKDPLVRQDLEIMIKAAHQNIRGSLLSEMWDVPYFNLPRNVFLGIRSLLDDQVPPERRKAALVRLRRYAGMEPGYDPIVKLAEDRTRERLSQPGLLGPVKEEVERNLNTSALFVNGIGQLFQRYKIEGYEKPYAELKRHLAQYDEFVRTEVLPRARTDFRLPPEEYAFNLEQVGVDILPGDLAAQAHAAFTDIQKQMSKLAPEVARQHGWTLTDYRDVIRELKKDQLVGEAILPHYQARLKEIEGIIQKQRLVTLPSRPARIRLASAAESANVPAPNMRPPRLIGNTGEQGEFVLPLNIPAPPGSKEATQKFDDFTFAADSWTLVAHEARPGHELQFAAMLERGVSLPRAIFAFNSTNVEGWGLYAEAITQPYMPPDGQLIALQSRLMRAARAFLDPELQAGKVTREQALKILKDEVVLSDAMANQEVQRYTFLAPGQATSYFYGFTRLMQLREEVKKAQGKQFDQQRFHDFILSQGLLPPNLLRKAVLEDFLGRKPGN
ncbi:MAG: DUF885 domain-containing protein [Terriglobales bacterium]